MDRVDQLRSSGRTLAPVNCEIDLSNRCTLGCEWCHFSYTHTRGPLAGKRDKPEGAVPGGDLMSRDLAAKIVLQLFDAGVRSITWTGGGEPTVHPDFDEIIRFTSLLELSQGLYTHGGHISDDRASLLKRCMDYVYVSLDAADSDSYKSAKGVDRFHHACEGIRRLAEADGKATIGVGFLVTPDNYKDVAKAADLAASLGADYLQCRPTVQYTQASPNTPAENTRWIDNAIRSISQAMYYQLGFIEADIPRFRAYQNWQGHGYETCWWTTLQTCVTPNGKVWACVNKREHPDAELGDLSVEPFADVWARHMAVPVDSSCRVMCRGHLGNQTLQQMTASFDHQDFI